MFVSWNPNIVVGHLLLPCHWLMFWYYFFHGHMHEAHSEICFSCTLYTLGIHFYGDIMIESFKKQLAILARLACYTNHPSGYCRLVTEHIFIVTKIQGNLILKIVIFCVWWENMTLFTHSLHGSKRAYSIKTVDDPFNRDNYPWQYPIWEANTDHNQKQPSITSFIFHLLNGFQNWPWKKCKLTLLIEIKLTQIILSFLMIYKNYKLIFRFHLYFWIITS